MSRKELSAKVQAEAFLRAKGKCEGVDCGARLTIGKYHFDHVIPDGLTGEPTLENCQVLCFACHKEKTTKRDIPAIAKAKRRERKHIGVKKPRSIRSWRKFDGTPVHASRER